VVTLSSLITAVNTELENFTQRGSAEAVGDGAAGAFLISPLGRQIVDDDTFAVYINGSLTTTYTMDFDSGVCEMDAVPTTSQTVSWQFNHVSWSDALVTTAINAGIENLFPSVYVQTSGSVTTDGQTFEYAAPATAEFITKIESRASASSPFVGLKHKRYDLFYTAGAPWIRFYSAPAAGFLRVHYVGRPVPLVSASDGLLAVALIPERTQAPIVSYACYDLLTQKMAPRVRSDVGVVTVGTGVLMPSQMNYASQGYMMRYQLQLAAVKMSLWSM
jgi:hypothetical protein